MKTEIPLGKPTAYPEQYTPELLHPISRMDARSAFGLAAGLPFHGTDFWNAWELTWLNADGKPVVATAEIRVPAESPNIVESKSLKLYLDSFSMTTFVAASDVEETIAQDLSACTGADAGVLLLAATAAEGKRISSLPGDCLDDLDTGCKMYEIDSALLTADRDDVVAEELHSHLLRSLCPVTGQPDIGSILISYTGPRIARPGLLQYIVSYREHQDFHESCVERMFIDLLERCQPEKLSIQAHYQRRGGIDINPFRSNCDSKATNARLWRQ